MSFTKPKRCEKSDSCSLVLDWITSGNGLKANATELALYNKTKMAKKNITFDMLVGPTMTERQRP